MTNNTVFLNGQYLPLSQANVSVLDRGFLFGDGVYEVIPVYCGRPFHLDAHLQRLEDSLAGIRLANPYTRQHWQGLFAPLLDASKDQYIYLHITRGAAPKRDHGFPEEVAPTVFIMCCDIVPFAGLNSGIKAVTGDDSRWQFCNIKAIALLANLLHRQSALDVGCTEAILLKDGYVSEGAASNVFAVIDGVLVTPPKDNKILAGITREVIIDLAHKNGIACAEASISEAQLRAASEIWVTSSTREILAVVELDAQAVGTGEVGAVWQRMHTLFQAYKQSLV